MVKFGALFHDDSDDDFVCSARKRPRGSGTSSTPSIRHSDESVVGRDDASHDSDWNSEEDGDIDYLASDVETDEDDKHDQNFMEMGDRKLHTQSNGSCTDSSRTQSNLTGANDESYLSSYSDDKKAESDDDLHSTSSALDQIPDNESDIAAILDYIKQWNNSALKEDQNIVKVEQILRYETIRRDRYPRRTYNYLVQAREELTKRGITLHDQIPLPNKAGALDKKLHDDSSYFVRMLGEMLYVQSVVTHEMTRNIDVCSELIDLTISLWNPRLGLRIAHNMVQFSLMDFIGYLEFIVARLHPDQPIPADKKSHRVFVAQYEESNKHTKETRASNIMQWLRKFSIFTCSDQYAVFPKLASSRFCDDKLEPERKWPIMQRDLAVYVDRLLDRSRGTLHTPITAYEVLEIAFCLLSLHTGARMSELIKTRLSVSGVRLRDIRFSRSQRGTIIMTIGIDCHKRKVDNYNGQNIAYELEETDKLLCPVRWILLHLEHRNVFTSRGSLEIQENKADEYLFQSGKTPLHGDWVDRGLVPKIACVMNVDRYMISHRSFRRGYAHEKAYTFLSSQRNVEDIEYFDILCHLESGVQWTSDVCDVYINHGEVSMRRTLEHYKERPIPRPPIQNFHKFLSQLGVGCQLASQDREMDVLLRYELFRKVRHAIDTIIVDNNRTVGPLPPAEELGVILDINDTLGIESTTYDSSIEVSRHSDRRRMEPFMISEKVASTKFNRNVQMSCRLRSFKCPQCVLVFTTRQHMKDHSETHTDRVRSFECTEPGCGKAFNNKHIRDEHSKTHTDRLRSFKCAEPGCGKAFNNKRNLNEHSKTHTDRVRSFKCAEPGCGKAFHTKSELTRHLKLHTDSVRSFECAEPGCGKAFNSKRNRDDHSETHTDRVRSFKCAEPGCRESIPHQTQLKRALKDPHRPCTLIRLYTAEVQQRVLRESTPQPTHEESPWGQSLTITNWVSDLTPSLVDNLFYCSI